MAAVAFADVEITEFIWTDHALDRIAERGVTRSEVQAAIREAHEDRVSNLGRADWLVATTTESGIRIEAIYDHPYRGDEITARIVSVWRVDG